MSTLISPFGPCRLTSSWGWREILGRPLTFHRGEDLAPLVPGARGQSVVAPVDLEILFVTKGTYSTAQRKWLGNDYTGTWNTGPLVVARGRGKWSGYWFAFGHLAGITVKEGDKVPVGTVLGTAGDQGNVSGVHLHFEIWTSSKPGGGYAQGNTIDPYEFYKKHGVQLGSAPDLTKTPTTLEKIDDMDVTTFNREMSRHAENTVRQTTDNVRVLLSQQSTNLHNAFKVEVAKAVEDAIRRLSGATTISAADVERIRVAILGDKHPAMPNTDMRGLVVSTYRDVQTLRALVDALSGAIASIKGGGDFDVELFLDGIDERIATRMAGLTDEVIDSLAVDVTVGKKE